MAYHDDLLVQALGLVHSGEPSQATLRRAVSTAYYAVFHLLIAEATANWSQAGLRTTLGRAFDHGVMRAASNRILNAREYPFTGQDPGLVANPRLFALTSVQLQEDRKFADYNLTTDLDPSDALGQVKSAEQVFKLWPFLKDAAITQAYLVSLVVRHP